MRDDAQDDYWASDSCCGLRTPPRSRPHTHTSLVTERRTSSFVSEMMIPLVMEARRYAQDFH